MITFNLHNMSLVCNFILLLSCMSSSISLQAAETHALMKSSRIFSCLAHLAPRHTDDDLTAIGKFLQTLDGGALDEAIAIYQGDNYMRGPTHTDNSHGRKAQRHPFKSLISRLYKYGLATQKRDAFCAHVPDSTRLKYAVQFNNMPESELISYLELHQNSDRFQTAYKEAKRLLAPNFIKFPRVYLFCKTVDRQSEVECFSSICPWPLSLDRHGYREYCERINSEGQNNTLKMILHGAFD